MKMDRAINEPMGWGMKNYQTIKFNSFACHAALEAKTQNPVEPYR
jgi:hypothetical protein